MGVKTKERSQAQLNFVIDFFKQCKIFRLIQEATGRLAFAKKYVSISLSLVKKVLWTD